VSKRSILAFLKDNLRSGEPSEPLFRLLFFWLVVYPLQDRWKATHRHPSLLVDESLRVRQPPTTFTTPPQMPLARPTDPYWLSFPFFFTLKWERFSCLYDFYRPAPSRSFHKGLFLEERSTFPLFPLKGWVFSKARRSRSDRPEIFFPPDSFPSLHTFRSPDPLNRFRTFSSQTVITGRVARGPTFLSCLISVREIAVRCNADNAYLCQRS